MPKSVNTPPTKEMQFVFAALRDMYEAIKELNSNCLLLGEDAAIRKDVEASGKKAVAIVEKICNKHFRKPLTKAISDVQG